jgi:hypothetical protein
MGIATRLLYVTVSVVVLSSFAARHTIASTQGTVGPTSTGIATISVTKNTVSRISGINDMSVVWDISDDAVQWTNDICIYSSRANGSYKITGQGASSAGGAFVLVDGSSQLPYSVLWNAGGSGNLTNEGTALVPGVSLANLTQASTTSLSCSGASSNARLIVNISKQNLQTVPAGHYAESLTLIVAPD